MNQTWTERALREYKLFLDIWLSLPDEVEDPHAGGVGGAGQDPGNEGPGLGELLSRDGDCQTSLGASFCVVPVLRDKKYSSDKFWQELAE